MIGIGLRLIGGLRMIVGVRLVAVQFLGTFLLLGSVHFSDPASAQRVETPLSDPVDEARARSVMTGLRCLVCQNQSIVDSNAELAQQLRIIVRERVAAGDSSREIRASMVALYGDWVLMKPPFKATTGLLWAGPALIFVFALIGVIFYFRRRRTSGAAGLTPAEQARVEALLSDTGDQPE